MNPKWLMAGVLLLGAVALAMNLWPASVGEVFQNIFALSNVAIFFFAAAVLAWFAYYIILRRLFRARRIANARMRRMLRESRDRNTEDA